MTTFGTSSSDRRIGILKPVGFGGSAGSLASTSTLNWNYSTSPNTELFPFRNSATSNTNNAWIKYRFRGRYLGVIANVSSTTGILRVQVDSLPTVDITFPNANVTLPLTVMISNDLDDIDHEVTFTVIHNPSIFTCNIYALIVDESNGISNSATRVILDSVDASISIPVRTSSNFASGSLNNFWNNVAVVTNGVSATFSCSNYNQVRLFVTVNAVTDIIVQYSPDGGNYFDSTDILSFSATGSKVLLVQPCASNIRLKSTNAATITAGQYSRS